MPIRIIDNKRIDLTEDEFSLYNKICRSYDRLNFKGEELFKNTFETDDDGIIVFITPPANRQFSMECFMFVTTLMHQQHLRVFYKTLKDYLKSADGKMQEQINSKVQEFIKSTNEKLHSLNSSFVEETKINYKELAVSSELSVQNIKKEIIDDLNSKKEEVSKNSKEQLSAHKEDLSNFLIEEISNLKKEISTENDKKIESLILDFKESIRPNVKEDLNKESLKFEEFLNSKVNSFIKNFKDSLKDQIVLDLEAEKAKIIAQIVKDVKKEILS